MNAIRRYHTNGPSFELISSTRHPFGSNADCGLSIIRKWMENKYNCLLRFLLQIQMKWRLSAACAAMCMSKQWRIIEIDEMQVPAKPPDNYALIITSHWACYYFWFAWFWYAIKGIVYFFFLSVKCQTRKWQWHRRRCRAIVADR